MLFHLCLSILVAAWSSRKGQHTKAQAEQPPLWFLCSARHLPAPLLGPSPSVFGSSDRPADGFPSHSWLCHLCWPRHLSELSKYALLSDCLISNTTKLPSTYRNVFYRNVRQGAYCVLVDLSTSCGGCSECLPCACRVLVDDASTSRDACSHGAASRPTTSLALFQGRQKPCIHPLPYRETFQGRSSGLARPTNKLCLCWEEPQG